MTPPFIPPPILLRPFIAPAGGPCGVPTAPGELLQAASPVVVAIVVMSLAVLFMIAFRGLKPSGRNEFDESQ